MIRLDTIIGEIGKRWRVTILKPDGTARDLSGATVSLIVERNTTKAGVDYDPPNGIVDFVIADGDYQIAGVFEGRIGTSGLTGGISTFTEKLRVNVEAVPVPAP